MKQTLSPTDKILSRKVIHRGKTYILSIIEIDGCHVQITPFEQEVHSTRYVDHSIRILRHGYKSLEDWHRDGDFPELIFE